MKQTLLTVINISSAGNVTAKTPAGKRVFIAKSLASAFELKVADTIHAIIDDEIIHPQLLDEEGQPFSPPQYSKDEIVRLAAMSLYKTKEDMLTAYNAEATFDLEAKVELAKTATNAGLSEAAIKALVAQSI